MANVTKFLILLSVLAPATAIQGFEKIGVYGGDILLAAFFPIHGKVSSLERELWSQIPNTPNIGECGTIQSEDGIQYLESMYLALDMINADPDLLPGVELGAVVFDTCDQEIYALEQAVELIRFLMTRSTLDDYPFVCRDGSLPSLSPDLEQYQNVVGVLGGSSSGVSIQLASLLRLFEVPQVSYLSTSPDLSNEDRFPYFKRVVPSDNTQVRVIVEILRQFNWTYVSVVYDDTNYGMMGYEEIAKVARISGICIAYSKKIETDSPNWGQEDYDKIMRDLTSADMKSKVAILYTTGTQARQLFQAADRTGRGRNIVWLGGDAWSGRESVIHGLEDVVHRAITVQPLSFQYNRFDEYFRSLDPKLNERNPWFTEFWEHHFNCTFVYATSYLDYIEREIFRVSAGTLFNRIYFSNTICTGNEIIGKNTGYKQQGNIHFVREATYSFANALTEIQEVLCGDGFIGLCGNMRPENLSGSLINKFLGNVKFPDLRGKNFTFVNRRDGPPRYSIKTYRKDLPAEERGWIPIGNYSGVDGEKGFTFDPVFEDWMEEYPTSVCSEVCGAGQIHVFLPGDECCWICTNCTEFEIALPIVELCYECMAGTLPDVNQTLCEPITEAYMSFSSPWAIGSMAFAGVGFLATTIILVVFVQYQNTPVIKASGREVSYYLLAGIFLSYVSTFVFVARPSVGICAVSRILLGLCYTIIYAAILTKTNRISRIFNDSSKSPKKPKYTSPKSQMIIVNIMVAIELIIIASWLGAATPRVKRIYPTRYDNILVCDGSQDARYLVPLVYPFLLLVGCAVYAFKTRKTPDGFNETKFIGFTSYTTGLIWLAFIPLYFSTTSYKLRAFTMCIGLSLTASVALACLFVPKIYICLYRPEKNTREAIMARSSSVTSGTMFMEQGMDLHNKTVTTGTATSPRIEGTQTSTSQTSQADGKKKISQTSDSAILYPRKDSEHNVYSITPTQQSMLAAEVEDTLPNSPPMMELYGTSRDPICDTLEVEISLSEPKPIAPARRKYVGRAETMHQPFSYPPMGTKRDRNERKMSH